MKGGPFEPQPVGKTWAGQVAKHRFAMSISMAELPLSKAHNPLLPTAPCSWLVCAFSHCVCHFYTDGINTETECPSQDQNSIYWTLDLCTVHFFVFKEQCQAHSDATPIHKRLAWIMDNVSIF